ncbi:hypothetical protein D3C71_1843940 [compost metagenome]
MKNSGVVVIYVIGNLLYGLGAFLLIYTLWFVGTLYYLYIFNHENHLFLTNATYILYCSLLATSFVGGCVSVNRVFSVFSIFISKKQ